MWLLPPGHPHGASPVPAAPFLSRGAELGIRTHHQPTPGVSIRYSSQGHSVLRVAPTFQTDKLQS